MRMNSDELFSEFEKDYAAPIPEDAGQKIAEIMEDRLNALMDKYEKKLQELTEANAKRPEDLKELEKIAGEVTPPAEDEGGGEDV